MSTMNTIIRYLMTTVAMLLMSICAMAQSVESALEKFDKQTSVAAANLFFDELLKAEFIDEETVFPAGTPSDSLQQQVWFWAAEWMYDQQQFEKAESYALKALQKYSPSNPEKADCLNTLGCIYVRLSDFKQAANYAKQSVEIEMKGGDHDRISSSLNTLAGIYMAGYQAKEAEGIILQALEHANQVDNPGRKAIILGMASEVYHTLGDDEKALPYAEQAIEIEKAANDYLAQDDLPKSLTMSKFIKRTIDHRKRLEMSNGETGFQYFIENMPDEALVLLDEPENSLSAEWQVSLAHEIYNLATRGGCQLVIATHSPFILSLPDAKIYNLDTTPVQPAKWYELDNMRAYYNLFKMHRSSFESK